VAYFPTKHLGLEASVPFYSTKGVSVSEVQAGVLARLPLGGIASRFSPYVGLGTAYSWQTDAQWAYVAKAGVEFRINSKIGLFTEGQYRDADLNFKQGETSLKGGIRLVF
jgi:outer membrane protein W